MDTHQSAGDAPGQPPGVVGYAGVLRELLPIALWREDAEGHVVEWSLAARDLLGHQPEDVLGRPASRVLVPDANRDLAQRLTRRVRAGETVVGTLPVRHRDGHDVTMEMWIVPATDPQGRPGTLLIAVETSEVLHMRDSLAALESLFTQSPIGLATLGPDLRFLRVNDALARMNGVSAAEHLGKRLTEVVPGVNAAALESMMRQVLDRGAPVVDARRTGRTAADPDRDRTWSCSYAPLLDNAGRRLGLIASLIDITEGQQAHADAERARRRFALLAEAGTRIGTTLDLRQTAEEMVQLLVPQLADSADVQLLEEVLEPDEAAASTRGVVRRVAAAFPDPSAPTAKLTAGMRFQIPLGSVYERVIADGRPMNLYQSDIPALITDPHADRLRAYLTSLGSARLIPLVARGKVLGAVVVTRQRSREPFDEQDCVLVDELVARAALNIDNARMYTTQREAALTLRRSLTNSALPAVTGLELTGRYLPASDHDVGGDWFDAISLPDGRTGLVIGDVMGHGIHSAAVMGQLRTAVRTLARHDVSPARMLRSLDAVVTDLGEDEMATCVYAVHDPAAAECVIARAGHPPPAVATAGGDVTFLGGSPGVPLGTGGRDFRTQRVPLPPGSLLVLYTDGLIEARDRDLDEGLEQLARALVHREQPLEALCDGILEQLLAARPVQDDVAVLLARTRRG
ncbi:protein phosphatase [Streptomyces agglomeratus]|uniref:protein-serine/threonine phosphatase n=1 Tax=Streptomyces agglomeratus TaxID=285458 RepID=A0A1E5P2S8_9ACTN|nr:SpoIIE family protein phosphatase [Streptomyces agglomeratus]OEJ23851.1 protein phosphatase [Streptomyces agglomeratus]OEJ43448.1 protein phosphatase [Streptomyces agglomeratus]OEJ54632.1 protein phosphatase [Streptomyces agglomeratus]OEJ62003.1 protein phosphatase [Streptomyces agglomeratus]